MRLINYIIIVTVFCCGSVSPSDQEMEKAANDISAFEAYSYNATMNITQLIDTDKAMRGATVNSTEEVETVIAVDDVDIQGKGKQSKVNDDGNIQNTTEVTNSTSTNGSSTSDKNGYEVTTKIGTNATAKDNKNEVNGAKSKTKEDGIADSSETDAKVDQPDSQGKGENEKVVEENDVVAATTNVSENINGTVLDELKSSNQSIESTTTLAVTPRENTNSTEPLEGKKEGYTLLTRNGTDITENITQKVRNATQKADLKETGNGDQHTGNTSPEVTRSSNSDKIGFGSESTTIESHAPDIASEDIKSTVINELKNSNESIVPTTTLPVTQHESINSTKPGEDGNEGRKEGYTLLSSNGSDITENITQNVGNTTKKTDLKDAGNGEQGNTGNRSTEVTRSSNTLGDEAVNTTTEVGYKSVTIENAKSDAVEAGTNRMVSDTANDVVENTTGGRMVKVEPENEAHNGVSDTIGFDTTVAAAGGFTIESDSVNSTTESEIESNTNEVSTRDTTADTRESVGDGSNNAADATGSAITEAGTDNTAIHTAASDQADDTTVESAMESDTTESVAHSTTTDTTVFGGTEDNNTTVDGLESEPDNTTETADDSTDSIEEMNGTETDNTTADTTEFDESTNGDDNTTTHTMGSSETELKPVVINTDPIPTPASESTKGNTLNSGEIEAHPKATTKPFSIKYVSVNWKTVVAVFFGSMAAMFAFVIGYVLVKAYV